VNADRLAKALVLITLVWGVLAFGAVYPWAARTLAVLCTVSGLVATRFGRDIVRYVGWPVTAAFLLLLASISMQLVPLPESVIARVSPATVPLLRQIDLAFAIQGAAHPLSIAPAATRWAALMAAAFFIFMAGVASLTSRTGSRWLVESLTLLGGAIALLAIVIRFSGTLKVYGFWQPELSGATPFGPFVNRNHYGGWMVLALLPGAAMVLASLIRPVDGRPSWRDRVLWLGSGEGSRVLLMLLAILLMTASVALTLSRSGLSALGFGLLLLALIAAARSRIRAAKLLPVLVVAGLVLVAAAVNGLGALEQRYNDAAFEFGYRRGAWADAVSVIERFPATGTGIATYRTAMLIFQKHNQGTYYAQAHNDYLQVLAEGGALVAVPALLLLAALVAQILRRFRESATGDSAWWVRTGAVVALIAMGLQETVEFSLQMPGTAALFAALCGIALNTRRARRPAA
jgi:O-antigen ligase